MKFWDPRMRKALLARLDDAELDPLPRQAAERLKAQQPAEVP
jgi:hypothetical protein